MSKLAFIFVLFAVITNAEINEDTDLQNVEKRNDFVRTTFGKLLKSLIKINEQRFDAMKKFTKLQDYNIAMDSLRNGRDDINKESGLAIVILDGWKHKNPEVKPQSATRMDSSDSSETDGSSEDDSSLRVFKSCQKKAAKVCRKACNDAYKAACSEYACSKKLKKPFKKECKIACQNRFH